MTDKKSIVGDLINFRGLVYAPLNENGVVYLFGKVTEDLHMYVEEIKPGKIVLTSDLQHPILY